MLWMSLLQNMSSIKVPTKTPKVWQWWKLLIKLFAYIQEYSLSVKLESHAWLDNSSASHYLTPYNSYLQNSKCNVGSNKVYVGSGQTLTIKAIGSVYFHSMYAPHKFLLLSYVLHVPTITRNLLSISKLSMDNNVIFEFLTEMLC